MNHDYQSYWQQQTVNDHYDHNFFTPLKHYGIIAIEGPDAENYLQGQLSCDVTKISNGSLLGCCCNVQGRVQAIFRLFKHENRYCMRLNRDIIDNTISRLKQYAIFSKLQIDDISDELYCIGIDTAALTEEQQALSHSIIADHTYELYVPAAQLNAICERMALPIASQNSWKKKEFSLKLANIYQDTYEKFLPHDLNLDQLGALDFNKGCYTGQEIVARMHYLGKRKRQLYRLNSESTQALSRNETIIAEQADRVAGHIVDNCEQQILAVLDKNYINQKFTIESSKIYVNIN